MRIFISLVALLLFVSIVGAQTKDPAPASDPAYNPQNSSHFNCQILAGKHWMALTDPSTSVEDAAYHQRAAEAYEHLDSLSWPC